MKELPDDETLEMMWRVAVTSSISTGLGVHKHYAWMLYNYITDKQFPVGLCDDFKGKESTAEKT
jgi:hypothetical protein